MAAVLNRDDAMDVCVLLLGMSVGLINLYDMDTPEQVLGVLYWLFYSKKELLCSYVEMIYNICPLNHWTCIYTYIHFVISGIYKIIIIVWVILLVLC